MLATFEEARLRKRMLSILRQNSEHLLLYFDTYGFTSVDRLIAYVRNLKGFETISRADLRQVVENDPKRQLEWDGGALIRATYGFLPERSRVGVERRPPEILHYGTHRKLLGQIAAGGLLPIASELVQLAADPSDIGTPGDTLMILAVRAQAAHDNGVRFFQATERYYFSEAIPASFLDISC
jgi:putative RNA 2'-phosphotransferase